MTIKEKTFNRWNPLSQWCRENLPDSNTGFLITDVDYLIYDKQEKRIMLLEVKSKNYNVANWQKEILTNLHMWISKGIDSGWKYLGVHLIVFENTNFMDGKVFFDNKEITEQELIKKLSLGRCEK